MGEAHWNPKSRSKKEDEKAYQACKRQRRDKEELIGTGVARGEIGRRSSPAPPPPEGREGGARRCR